jgi:hypothetical protein
MSAKQPARYVDVPDVAGIPDLYDDAVAAGNTSPEGRPWAKCCYDCAFRDPGQRAPIERACGDQGAAFYCIHQEDEAGNYRVCAGFAARDKRQP